MHLRILMLCLLASPAYAQSSFRPATPDPLEKRTSLECMPVQATDIDRRDSIQKILVKLVLDDAGSPTDLSVVHSAISGASYSRADQYTRSDLRQISGRTEYYWTGVWNKNPAVTMKGSLAQAAGGRWTYVEEQFRSGIAQFWMRSDCRVIPATAPQPDDKVANVPVVGPSTPNLAHDPPAIAVQISVAATAANPPEISGNTNLPDGTIFTIQLTGNPPGCVPRCGYLYAPVTVEHGRFTSTTGDASPLFSGSYTIHIMMPIASRQPEKVQSVIGKFGERLTFPGTMEPDAYEKFLGLIFHYRQTIQVAGDAASDIAIRTQAIADFRDSNAYRCTDSIDFVNALVRSGAVTGRETLGDERKSKIETCVAELEAKLQAALKSESPSNIQPDARKLTLGVTPTRSLGPASRGPFGCGTVRCPPPAWERVEADNGSVYFVDVATVSPVPPEQGIHGKQILIYLDDGREPQIGNTEWYTFDCERPLVISHHFGVRPQYVPPRSVFGEIRRIACRDLWAADRPKPEDYCDSFSTDACDRIKGVVEAYALSQVRPTYCKPGFGLVDSGLTPEQMRICYVIAGWPQQAR